ncbi:MAG TPA: 30S ribosomal protein S12 methylthiotransferase RimO [Desulfotomaculum sp.]|nr:30S ribosomal protein S12 methylthiotransferase RimO [Desulfotomaculum sp.]
MSCLVGMVSLGCAKNLVDSEIMLGLLKEAGFVITTREEEAEVLIVNTCGFIQPAQEESIQNILKLARLKQVGRCRALLVAGCLSQRYGNQLLAELPEVDGLIGTGAVPGVADLVKRALAGERFCAVTRPFYEHTLDLPRLRATPYYTAYVKIAEGCSNHCAFCVIPVIRGAYRSRPMEFIEGEVRSLVNQGVKEIILVAQDTTRYGLDLYGEYRLAALLRRLAATYGLVWLRLLYCSVDHFTEELIHVLAEERKICRYLDIPVQHASDKILKRMNRRRGSAGIRRLISLLRTAVPGLVLRTTFLVGFPGEKDRHFEELLDFMAEVSFERAGVFKFYPEEGTLAASMPEQVPEEIKEDRFHRAMVLQQQISLKHNQSLIGKEITVLVEGKNNNVYYGRSEADAPEVDGRVYFTSQKRRPGVGEFVRVSITQAREYDLIGEL